MWQERRCGERESSWTRDKTMSSVDWEISTLSTARIPETHSCTMATDTWRESEGAETFHCSNNATATNTLKQSKQVKFLTMVTGMVNMLFNSMSTGLREDGATVSNNVFNTPKASGESRCI